MKRALALIAISLLASDAVASVVGRFSSIAIGSDGLPLISYHESGWSWLRVAHCSNVACTSASIRKLAPGGATTSLAIGSDGLGLILFSDSNPEGVSLKTAHCDNVECTSARVSTLAHPPGEGSAQPRSGGSLAIGSDALGLFPYLSRPSPLGQASLVVAHCSDVACTAVTNGALVATGDLDSDPRSGGLAIGSDGLGLFTFTSPPFVGGVAHCHDVPCSSVSTSTVSSFSPHGSMAIGSDGNGLFPWFTQGLRVGRCADAPCSSFSSALVDRFATGDAAIARGLDGLGLIAYGGQALKVAHCSNLDCSAATITVLDATVLVDDVDVAIGSDGLGVISYSAYSASLPDTVLRVAHCQNVECTSASVTVVDDGGADLAILMNGGNPDPVRWGQSVNWNITAFTLGPLPVTGARIVDHFPVSVTGVTWTCQGSAGAACPAPSGSGDIDAVVTFANVGSLLFRVTGTVSPFTFGLTNSATIAAPPGFLDPYPSNDAATFISVVEPTSAQTLAAPCRVVDTRTNPPALGANTTREFAVAGTCGVPPDARAVAVIATAVNPGDLGNLRLYPAGTPLPLASMLNFAAGRTRANNAIVPLGPGGQVSVRCDMPTGSTATTDFLLDVTAYFK